MIDVRYASDIARGPLFILGGAGEGSLEERRRSQATLSTLLHRLDNTCPLFFTTMWKQRTPPAPLRWVSLVIETAALRPCAAGTGINMHLFSHCTHELFSGNQTLTL